MSGKRPREDVQRQPDIRYKTRNGCRALAKEGLWLRRTDEREVSLANKLLVLNL